MPAESAQSLGPTRYQAPLPEVTRFPRVGRLRLGEAVATGKQGSDGSDLFRPSAVDYFRVVEDDSGITSSEAAASFHAAYGAEPRAIKIQLVGATPEAMLDYAWRLYGASRLKRRCEGPGGRSSIRLESGTWRDGPCQCEQDGVPVDRKGHCEPSFTFQFLLPDVAGVGVWDLASKSVMSRDAIAGFLELMLATRGSIAMLECTMRVVMKPGKTGGLVPTVDLQAFDATPRQMIAAAAAPRGELGRVDDEVERTIQASHHAPEDPQPGGDDPEPVDASSAAKQREPAGAEPAPVSEPAPARSREAELAEIQRANVDAQIRFLGPEQTERLKQLCEVRGVKPSRNGLIEAWGSRAEDLNRLITELDQDAASGEQTSLDPGDDEPLIGEVVAEATADDGVPF